MFKINTNNIMSAAAEISEIQKRIQTIESCLGMEASGYVGTELRMIRFHLDAVKNSVSSNAFYVGSTSKALQSIGRLYEKIEENIAGIATETNVRSEEADIKALEDILKMLREELPKLQNGLLPLNHFGGDPVNMATGNFIYQTVGLHMGGLFSYIFRCFYNSIGREDGAFGPGWTGTQEKYLEFRENAIIFHDARGEITPFVQAADGANAVGRAGLFLTSREFGYEVQKSDVRIIFNTEGRVMREEDLCGNGVNYIYDGCLREILADNGCSLLFFYDNEGHILQVSNSNGDRAFFSYEDGCLREVTINGNTTTFEYDEEGNLSVIRNEYLESVRNQYDQEGRVTEQSLGEDMKFSYNHEGRFLVYTRPNGSHVIYERDKFGRIISIKTTLGEELYAYNSRNQRIRRTDRLGNVFRYQYDERGNLTAYIDPRGCKTSYTYNSDNQVISVRQANGGQLQFKYQNGTLAEFIGAMGQKILIENNAQGLPIRICYPDGGEEKKTYDEAGNLIRFEKSGRGVEEYTYDEKSRLIEALKNGETTYYQYNDKGKIISIIRPDGTVRQFSYTHDNKISSVKDFDGSVKKWVYNHLGKVASFEDACGNRTQYSYDKEGHIVRKVYPNGSSALYIYDEEGRNTEVSGDGVFACRYEYDAENRMTAVIAADGNRTEYAYDPCGNVVEVKTPDGSIKKYYYDELGNVTRESGPGSRERYFKYDLSGRLVGGTDEFGISYENRYDDMDRLIRHSNIGRNTILYEYYPGGQLKKRMDMAGGTEECFYDDYGRMSARRFNDSYTLNYTMDKLGRVVAVTDSLGASKKAEYDQAGRITVYVDANGNQTKYAYTKDGKIAEIEDAYGSRLTYRYDSMGNTVEMRRMPFGNESEAECIQYIRNVRGQVVETIDPMGFSTALTYDGSGKIKTRRNRLSEVTEYGYDVLGNCASIHFADGQVFRYKYDADGAMIGFSDENGDVSIRRDLFGNPEEIIDYDGKKMWLTWKHGLKTEETYFNGFKIFYDYDQCGRLMNTRFGEQSVMRLYDRYGRLSEKNSTDGSFERFFYDPSGKLTELQIGAGTKVFKKIAYAYDPCGNKTQINISYPETSERDVRWTYTYDRLNRIQDVYENEQLVREYQYDGLGNRKSVLSQNGITEYAYDTASRLRQEMRYSKEGVVSEEIRYKYDAEGRLIEKSSDKESGRYSYNGLGRLVAEVTDNGRSERVYSALGKLIKVHSDNAFVRYRVDHTERDNRILEKEEADNAEQYIWNETLSAIVGDSGYTSAYTDDLGSVVNLFSGDNMPLMDAVYDEYGRQAEGYGVTATVGYAGMLSLHDSKLQYGFERAYDASTGRFVSEDPVRGRTKSVQNENPYIYCFNKPLILIDQSAAFPSWADFTNRLSDMGDDVWNGIRNGMEWTGDRLHEIYENGRNAARTITTEIRRIPERINEAINDVRDNHYNRNRHNEWSDISEIYTIDEYGNIQGINGWEKQPDSANVYHRNTNGEQGEEAKNNVKFTHKNPDGSSYEVVICFPNKKTREPYIVTDPYNAGTYNYSNPEGIPGAIGHFFLDMIPYWIWGNQEEDSSASEFWNRVLGPEKGSKIKEIIEAPYRFLSTDWRGVLCVWNG